MLDETTVHRALQALDSNLFLDKRWSAFSGVYYCAVRKMPDGIEDLIAVDWRDGIYAKPLSLDLVDQVRAQEGNISESISLATAHNAARKELVRQERLAKQDEAIEEWQKSGRSTGIPAQSSIVVSKDLPG